jgi:hypothetical protein
MTPLIQPTSHQLELDGGLVLLLAVGSFLTPPGRLAGKVLLILPELFLNAPVRPLIWVTEPPRREEQSSERTST